MRIFTRLNITHKTRYLIIPINLKALQHWSLSIIVLNSPEVPGSPLCKGSNILYLDSIMVAPEEVNGHLSRAVQLAENFVQKRASSSSSFSSSTGHKGLYEDVNMEPDEMLTGYPFLGARLNLPKQENNFDCGVFVIEYIARFLSRPLSLLGDFTHVVKCSLPQIETLMQAKDLYNTFS